MNDLIKKSDAIKHFKAKADHYRKRLARIEAQGDAIGYDPTEQINGFKDEIAIYESFVKELEDIPSAENKGEWIPCSERLPKVRTDILLCFEENMCVGFYDHGMWNTNTANGFYTGILESEDQPVAWMPLPEPYTKGADNE